MAAGLLALAVPAPALGAPELQFRWEVDHLRPAAPATALFKAGFRKKGDPAAKPPAVTALVIDPPVGTGLGRASVERCTADDLALMLRGAAACPAGSRIGGGGLTVMTGIGPLIDPLAFDASIFATPTGFVEVAALKGGGPTVALDRFRVQGRRIIASPPATPGGPPDGRSAVYDVEFRIGRRYVHTPAACPRGGWLTSARAEFADASTASTRGVQPCAGGAIRLKVEPARIRAGRRHTLRVKVTTATGAAATGALVRALGRRALTGPSGTARLRVRPRRKGLRRVSASFDGLRTRGRVRVTAPRRRAEAYHGAAERSTPNVPNAPP